MKQIRVSIRISATDNCQPRVRMTKLKVVRLELGDLPDYVY